MAESRETQYYMQKYVIHEIKHRKIIHITNEGCCYTPAFRRPKVFCSWRIVCVSLHLSVHWSVNSFSLACFWLKVSIMLPFSIFACAQYQSPLFTNL